MNLAGPTFSYTTCLKQEPTQETFYRSFLPLCSPNSLFLHLEEHFLQSLPASKIPLCVFYWLCTSYWGMLCSWESRWWAACHSVLMAQTSFGTCGVILLKKYWNGRTHQFKSQFSFILRWLPESLKSKKSNVVSGSWECGRIRYTYEWGIFFYLINFVS